MTKKYLIANWKMYKTPEEVIVFMQQFLPLFHAIDTAGLAMFMAPSFVHLSAISLFIDRKSPLQLLAQNCHHEIEGAFTGEVSALMLAAMHVSGVLIGHSERRIYQKEDDWLLAKKVKRVLSMGMQPFLCCGESLEDRTSGRHKAMVKQQLQRGLSAITPEEVAKLVIAYEPVWAIGTGEVASLAIIAEMHGFIRETLLEQYGLAEVPILYGGSCNPQNAKAIFSLPNVAGGLIGGASLEVNTFIELVKLLLA